MFFGKEIAKINREDVFLNYFLTLKNFSDF